MVNFLGIEGGGTSWVVVISEEAPENIIERAEFETSSDPSVTLGAVREWFSTRTYDAIGVATFGPVDANPASSTYGYITATPKPGWRDTDVLGLLGFRGETKPVMFDTDVNAPALAEFAKLTAGGQRPTLSSCAYITIGTGVGVGLVVNGGTVHGLMHPEAGHIFAPPLPGDVFLGNCPFHGNCIEGMCATPALCARLDLPASALIDLLDSHPIWDVVANQLAHLCNTLVMVASPQKISIGGGVMNRAMLYDKIRARFLAINNGYVQNRALEAGFDGLDQFIAPSHFGAQAGIVGASFLAMVAYEKKTQALPA
jgi:fructokinase